MTATDLPSAGPRSPAEGNYTYRGSGHDELTPELDHSADCEFTDRGHVFPPTRGSGTWQCENCGYTRPLVRLPEGTLPC